MYLHVVLLSFTLTSCILGTIWSTVPCNRWRIEGEGLYLHMYEVKENLNCTRNHNTGTAWLVYRNEVITNEWLRNCILVPVYTLLCVGWLASFPVSPSARSQRSHTCTRGDEAVIQLSYDTRPQLYCSAIQHTWGLSSYFTVLVIMRCFAWWFAAPGW